MFLWKNKSLAICKGSSPSKSGIDLNCSVKVPARHSRWPRHERCWLIVLLCNHEAEEFQGHSCHLVSFVYWYKWNSWFTTDFGKIPAAKEGWVWDALCLGLVIEDGYAYLTNRLWETLAKTPFGAPGFQGILCTCPCFLVQEKKGFQHGPYRGKAIRSHTWLLWIRCCQTALPVEKYVYSSFNNVAILYGFYWNKA